MTPQTKPNKARMALAQPKVEPNVFKEMHEAINSQRTMRSRDFLRLLRTFGVHTVRETGSHVVVKSEETGKTAKVTSRGSGSIIDRPAMINVVNTLKGELRTS